MYWIEDSRIDEVQCMFVKFKVFMRNYYCSIHSLIAGDDTSYSIHTRQTVSTNDYVPDEQKFSNCLQRKYEIINLLQ